MMGIRLDDEALELTLERAMALARGQQPVPQVWLERIERLGELGIKTYIAALGGALLAKATNELVDSLTQDEAAGARGYSLRRTTEFLALHNHDRFHLGATGRWPLNNRPFLGGPARIDEFTKISPRARPAFEQFRDALVPLNQMSAHEALNALAAYLRVRGAVQQSELALRRAALELGGPASLVALLTATEIFVSEDPEGGRRGQALAAAVLDCAFDDVRLRSINDPGAGDIRVFTATQQVGLAVEVKQLAVGQETPRNLAAEAAGLGADSALLVVLAPGHAALDREQARRHALADYGVVLEICESVRELVGAIAVFSSTDAAHILQTLPGAYAQRLREHGVSIAGQQRWRDLMDARV